MSYFRDTVLAAGSTVALAGGRFVTMAVIARTLGVEDFGMIAFAAMCVDLLVLAAMLGLPGVIGRFKAVAKPEEARAFGRLRLAWISGSLLAIAVLGPVVATQLVELADRALILFVIWAMVAAVQTVAVAEMQGAFRFDLFVLSSVLAAIALVGGAVFLVAPGDVASAMIVLALGPFVQALPLLILVLGRARPDRIGARAGLPPRREIAGFGVNQSLNAVLSTLVWSRGELFVIEGRLDASAVGLYSAGVALIGLVWRVLAMLHGASAPHLAERLHDKARVAAMVGPLTRLTMGICGAVALTIAVLGEPVAVLVFGPGFAGTGDLLVLMAPGAAVAGNGLVLLAVHYLSNGRFTRNALIVASLALLGVSWPMVGWLGAEGAALARTAVLVSVSAAMPIWLIGQGHGTLGRQVLVDLFAVVGLVGALAALVLVTDPGLAGRGVLALLGCYLLLGRATRAALPHRMVRRALVMLRDV